MYSAITPKKKICTPEKNKKDNAIKAKPGTLTPYIRKLQRTYRLIAQLKPIAPAPSHFKIFKGTAEQLNTRLLACLISLRKL